MHCGNTNLNEDMIVALLIPGVTTRTKFRNRTQSNQKHLLSEFDQFCFPNSIEPMELIIERSKPTLKIDYDFEKSFWRAKNQESSKDITREISKEPKKNQVKRRID